MNNWLLTYIGLDFGNDARVVSVTIGDVDCTDITVTHDEISCDVAAGIGASLLLSLTVDGQITSVSFSYEGKLYKCGVQYFQI